MTRGGLEPGEPREVATGLGVTGARQHAARLRHQRKDVARLAQVFGPRVRRARRCESCARGRSAEMPVVTPSAASIDT